MPDRCGSLVGAQDCWCHLGEGRENNATHSPDLMVLNTINQFTDQGTHTHEILQPFSISTQHFDAFLSTLCSLWYLLLPAVLLLSGEEIGRLQLGVKCDCTEKHMTTNKHTSAQGHPCKPEGRSCRTNAALQAAAISVGVCGAWQSSEISASQNKSRLVRMRIVETRWIKARAWDSSVIVEFFKSGCLGNNVKAGNQSGFAYKGEATTTRWLFSVQPFSSGQLLHLVSMTRGPLSCQSHTASKWDVSRYSSNVPAPVVTAGSSTDPPVTTTSLCGLSRAPDMSLSRNWPLTADFKGFSVTDNSIIPSPLWHTLVDPASDSLLAVSRKTSKCFQRYSNGILLIIYSF